MRKRTDKEKRVIGKAESIFRQLKINRASGGYIPLLDTVVYAYAFPEKSLTEIVDTLTRENYYLGIRIAENSNSNLQEKIYSEMVHTVKSALDCPNKELLKELGIDKLSVILGLRGEELEKSLMDELGPKYQDYTNDEKVVFFFIKKVLKAM